jgi:hypothetical protein
VAPPFVGVAVKVTADPAHVGLVPVVRDIATVGTSTGLIVMEIPALVAVVGLAQGELDVRTQVTIWPVVKALVVNVALLVPAGVPFTCH